MLRRYILAAAGATLAVPAIVSRGVLGQNLRKVKMGWAFTTTTNAAFLMPAILKPEGIDLEIVPALGELRPVGQRAETQERVAHVGGFDEGIARPGYRVADARGILQAGSDLAHVIDSSTGRPSFSMRRA